MARRKKAAGGKASQAWLVTFTDLMTLLLTFFVLLLSMSSMDSTVLSKISAMNSNISPIPYSGLGRAPERIRMVIEMIREPESLLNKLDRIKDLLFPDDLLPPELSAATLEENLRVLADPRGVVIVLTEGLIFEPGEGELNPEGRRLLEAVTPFLEYTTADVTISGHTDSQVPQGQDAYELSSRRAMSVLEYFLQQQLRPMRFSIAGYGPDRPMADNNTEKGRTLNRRVEILVKTTNYMGQYP